VPSRDEMLDSALDKGASTELPPNIPPGLLGEVAPDVRKVDEFEPTLNAGITQERTWETRWLLIGILYLVILGAPLALWLLWREPRRKVWAKVLATAVGLAGYVALYLAAADAMSRRV
jgi:hypothetical protein